MLNKCPQLCPFSFSREERLFVFSMWFSAPSFATIGKSQRDFFLIIKLTQALCRKWTYYICNLKYVYMYAFYFIKGLRFVSLHHSTVLPTFWCIFFPRLFSMQSFYFLQKWNSALFCKLVTNFLCKFSYIIISSNKRQSYSTGKLDIYNFSLILVITNGDNGKHFYILFWENVSN